MKKIFITLIAMLTFAVQTTVAMSYEQARNEALFLTDKMAYELNLSDAQYEAAYEINLDYLMSVTGYDDVGGIFWERRNADLRYILYSWQWDAFCAATYFFRPLYWEAGFWHFGVYARYPRRDYFFFGRPHFYASYRGGHSWRMNGGHSYYEHRRDVFRPGHVERSHHIGMRNHFDRGDYRGVHHGNSSTHVTGGRHFEGNRSGSHSGGNYSGNHSSGNWHNNGGNRGNHDNTGNRGNHDNTGNRGNHDNGGNHGNNSGSSHSNGSFSGSHSSSHGSGSHSSGSHSGSHSSGSFSGSHSGSHGSGSFSGSHSSGHSSSSHGSGSFSGTRSGSSSGHSSGSHSGGGRSGSHRR